MPPSQNPRVYGNRVAQRGSRIALVIDSCTSFASLTVYENTTELSPPGISECGGSRRVAGITYSLTANAQGEALFIRDLNYFSSLAADKTPGQIWYYQVKHAPIGGAPCKLSNVWSLNIINRSAPPMSSKGSKRRPIRRSTRREASERPPGGGPGMRVSSAIPPCVLLRLQSVEDSTAASRPFGTERRD